MTTLVLLAYFVEWARTPGRRGLVPLHIWLIALSYDLLIALVIFGGVFGRTTLDDDRAWIRIPALVFGLAGMFVLANFQINSYSYLRREHARARDAASRRSPGSHSDRS